MAKRWYVRFAVFGLDAVLIALPIVLQRLAGLEPGLLVPGVVALVIAMHSWMSHKELLAALDERVELAKLRTIAGPENSELYAFIDVLTAELLKKLERLKKGELLLESDDEYWLFVNKALSEAEADVKAIDVNLDPRLLAHWEAGSSLDEYYRCCLDVLQRGHSFERIFVFHRGDALDEDGVLRPAIAELLMRHSRDGIGVFLAWSEDLYGAAPKLPLDHDYLLFSGDKVVYAPTQQHDPYYNEAVVTKSAVDVRRFAELHEAIKRRAYPLSEFVDAAAA